MENLRFNETINYQIIKNLTQHSDSIFIPPMLIQPFAENAVKYAFKNQNVDKKIEISFTENQNSLTVLIDDYNVAVNQYLNLTPSEYKLRTTEITKKYLLQ